jgi:hypothetical protein
MEREQIWWEQPGPANVVGKNDVILKLIGI